MMGPGNVARSFVGGITNNTHWLRKAKRYLITIMMGCGNVARSFVGEYNKQYSLVKEGKEISHHYNDGPG